METTELLSGRAAGRTLGQTGVRSKSLHQTTQRPMSRVLLLTRLTNTHWELRLRHWRAATQSVGWASVCALRFPLQLEQTPILCCDSNLAQALTRQATYLEQAQ